MSAYNFNLRGIPSEVMGSLKKEAKRLHMSVNALILKMIQQGLGVREEKMSYHELDHLAGSWTAEEAREFKENTQFFEKIDKDLWE